MDPISPLTEDVSLMVVRTSHFSSGLYRIDLETEFHGFAELHRKPKPGELLLWINPRLRGKSKLETIIHESIHAEFPDMPESKVAAAGENIARLVWRLGYREQKQKKEN